MRSTIFISALAMALGLAAAAEAKPVLGCFTRDYSAAHLASQPGQIVQRMRLQLSMEEGAFYSASLAAQLAGQGRLKGAGLDGVWGEETAACAETAGGIVCHADCDGGRFTLTARSDGIDLTTENLWLRPLGAQDGLCAAFETLAEWPGESVTYRLYAADDALCGDAGGG